MRGFIATDTTPAYRRSGLDQSQSLPFVHDGVPRNSQMGTRIIESAKQTNAPEAMHNPKMTWHNFIGQQNPS